MISKEEAVYELYEKCRELDFSDTYTLVKNARNQEEREFIKLVTNFVLQQKQKRVISEKRF